MTHWEEEKKKIRDNIENDNRNTFISFQKDPAAYYPPRPQPNLDSEGPKFDERAPIIKSRNTGRNAEVIGRNRTHRAERGLGMPPRMLPRLHRLFLATS